MNFKYYSFCLAVNIARHLPMRLGYFLAMLGGDMFFLTSTKRRRLVGNKLQRATGKDQRKLMREIRSVFRNSAKNYFDLVKMPQMNWSKMDARVTIEGMQHLTQALDSGKGVILATAHLGNFEFSANILASRGIDMTIFVEAFDSTPFLQKIAALRQTRGIKIIPVDISGIRVALKTLQCGKSVTIVSDRDLSGNGIKINFLGESTIFPTGAVDLALRTGAILIPIFTLRGHDNKTSIFVEPPLKLEAFEDPKQEIQANLENLVAIFEKYIRQYPEQWVVLEPD